MQRKIAEELKLDPETMAMFDKQDEEDDFNGVDHGSRDVIRGVSQVIARTLVNIKFIMFFLNGSDDEIDVNRFGIAPQSLEHAVVWTFKRRSFTMRAHAHRGKNEISNKLRYTRIFISYWLMESELTTSEFRALLREEAANIVGQHPWMQGTDLTTMVTECCLYKLLLQFSFQNATGFDWAAHDPNYWTCDGIIKGDGTRKISDTLHQEVHWECNASLLDQVVAKLMEDPEAPFSVLRDGISFFRKRTCRWICVTSKDLIIQEDTKAILERASSLFIAHEKSDKPQGLPSGILTHCSSLGVLVLARCTFSFISPPFLQCHGLRFLWLEHCKHDNTIGEHNANWMCLQSLWVLDLCYTEWDDILSEEKMNIMTNLREVNIEGHVCWQLTNRLQGRWPYLQKLRIIKPTHRAETSIDCYNSFTDKVDLEILDLSGNRDMENLPASLSMAKSLQMLILDGCDGLENVVVPDGLPSSLRSFSFDGYGPATHWVSSFKLPLGSSKPKQPLDSDKRVVKTSKISLQGFTRLENLFVRGLPNLVELDLSGCAIKVLDLTTMVVNVPMLKRLFLLGCGNLRAIICGKRNDPSLNLELLCIDTRSERAKLGFVRPSLAQHKHFHFQLHAVIADARLAKSLYDLMDYHVYRNTIGPFEGIYYKIHVNPPTEYSGVVQFDATGKEITEPSNYQLNHVLASRYSDVTTQVGNAPMLVFPQPPTPQFDRHFEISAGSHNLGTELINYRNRFYFGSLMSYAESLYVHDVLSIDTMLSRRWWYLKWCRVERCPNLDTVFPMGPPFVGHQLETFWASDLRRARYIWSKASRDYGSFGNLRHLHLRSCPRLQFALPVWKASFPNLVSLHIIHCGDLTHIFVLDEKYPKEILVHGVMFPKLTTIHLHDLQKLQQIMCEVKMIAPALETIRVRGCFGLRRLPSLRGREPGVKKPAVEMEKDVWDALEWDGLAAGHHPDLFEPPLHSRYYRRNRLLRRTVLR
ncbi:unnamed protein product [Urochloa humidicola]